MTRSNHRPLVILVLGVLALFGVAISKFLLGDFALMGLIQILAAAGALLLLWREIRDRRSDWRWTIVAWIGGLCALFFLGGVALLWYIWPK